MVFAAGPATLGTPVSQLCTQSQFSEPSYAYWCREIREIPRYHRKQWEFTYISQALAMHGMLAPARRGIGFGVGREPLAALFAARGCQITATDLETDAAKTKGWVSTDQHATQAAMLNDRGICQADLFERNVEFRFADMNRIDVDCEQNFYDFCWSACSLEHLGSIDAGLHFIENSVKMLRPGGLAVHTTEYNCLSNDETLMSGPTVLFRRRDIETLLDRLAARGHSSVLNLTPGDGELDTHVDVPPYSTDRHLRLRLERFVTTSIGLIIRR